LASNDLVVLGGGVMGRFTAYHASAQGARVVILERGRVGDPMTASYGRTRSFRNDYLDTGYARLELTCGPDNLASQRVAERCGFTREGVLRSHVPFKGARRDSVVFSLLPGELR